MGWLFIVIAIVVLVIMFAVAAEFRRIAEEKGYSESLRYYLWTLLLFPVGALMVIALPDRNARPSATPMAPAPVTPAAPKKTVQDELPEL